MFTGKQRRAKKNMDYAKLHKDGADSNESSETLCPGCQLGGDDGISLWYGCDVCPKWWHRNCLPREHQLQAEFSTKDKTRTFRCPHCPQIKLCNVCFVEGESDYAQC